MKILITGACAVSARSVLRSLKKSEIFGNAEFIGWDMATLLYGVYEGLFDRLYKVPSVSDSAYRSVAQEILDKERPDAAIVVPEVEVLHWAKMPFPVPHFVPAPAFCELAISKKKLFACLAGTSLIPRSFELSRADAFAENFACPLAFPVWIRDSAAGTASGKGSFLAHDISDLRAWIAINRGIDNFQISEFLPGGNYGCFCLFKNGKLLKLAIAERQEYIMAKVAVSGITGNTARGRLLNDEKIRAVALDAVARVNAAAGTVANGLVVVDMRADAAGTPKVTEINIRHVAFSSSFANAGFNLSEYHLLCTLGRENELSPEIEKTFPRDNLILRDVDGVPLFVAHHRALRVGEFYARGISTPPHFLEKISAREGQFFARENRFWKKQISRSRENFCAFPRTKWSVAA